MRRTLRMVVHRTSKLVLGLVPLLSAGLVLFQACRAQSGPTVWVVPGLKRVAQTEAAGTGSTAQIKAARGETESFQIVVKAPAGGLTNVNVSVTDLVGPGTIPKANLVLYREHYVSVSPGSANWRGTNQPLGAGVYADGLIPFADPATGASLSGASLSATPFTVAAGANQPVWVDVVVPRDAPAGQYLGTFTVTSNQGNFTGQISLQVWNFTLPMTPSLQSSFAFWVASGQASHAELLKHRLTPLAVPAADQATLVSKYGLGTGNLGYWSGADVGNCSMSSAPSVTQLQNSVKNNQPSLKLFNFTADEIGSCTNLYPQIQAWARNLHQAGVDNLITMTPVSQLLDDGSGTGRSAVDIWALLPLMYQASPSMVSTVQQKGDKVWSANTLVQDSYSPKWEIDFDPINFRIQPGFINQSLGLSGLLYWRVDRWSSDPWNQVNNTGQFSTNNYPGEGMLVYPGTQVGATGVVASMRLKWLRDGADDFDYIALLKAKGYGDWALQLSRTVGPNWTTWTRDANLLESVRNQLGAKLDELAAPSAPSAPVMLSPANGSTTSTTPALTWSASTGATSYKVYLGTATTPALAGTVTGTSFSPSTLLDGTAYYWRVEAVNNGGTTSSPTWSFQTQIPLPSVPLNVSPSNGTTVSNLTPALQWAPSTNATSYDVYFGSSTSPALAGTLAGTSYSPGTLSGNSTYYWKVVAKNTTGSTTSAVWSFQTPAVLSGTPSNPAPANGATGVSLTPSLSWSGVSGATSFDVYFGTAASPPLVGNVAVAGYNPGTLSANTTYYWRVVAKNGSSTAASPVWSFKTLTLTSSSPTAPALVGLTPSSGSGSTAALSSVISDSNGYADIAGVNLLINSSLQGSGGCWLYVDIASRVLYLANDSGSSWSSAAIGSSSVLQNSQCSISLNQVSVSGAGLSLTLNTPLMFKSTFRGQKSIYLRAADKGGLNSGYKTMGSWTLP
ncbi:MAG: DUF4091 domain-containing protein [Bryobacteraceae bacterium]